MNNSELQNLKFRTWSEPETHQGFSHFETGFEKVLNREALEIFENQSKYSI